MKIPASVSKYLIPSTSTTPDPVLPLPNDRALVISAKDIFLSGKLLK